MFGSLGGAELLLILVLALLLFGPRRLPQIGRTMGRAMSEFRRATQDLKSSLEREVYSEELKETRDGIAAVGREIGEAVDEANPRRFLDDAMRPGGRGPAIPRSSTVPDPRPDPHARSADDPGSGETADAGASDAPTTSRGPSGEPPVSGSDPDGTRAEES